MIFDDYADNDGRELDYDQEFGRFDEWCNEDEYYDDDYDSGYDYDYFSQYDDDPSPYSGN